MTKMGLKRTTPKVSYLTKKRAPLRRVSQKQAKENRQMNYLADELRIKCNFKSELSGEFCVMLDPHHFGGRGKNLLNPFFIVMVTRAEHDVEQKHMSFKHKQELKEKVRPLRIAQGYKMEDYE